jgi:hypothetical protein
MSNPLDERKKALEEDYFHRQERELIEKMKAKMLADQAAASLPQCPKCDGKLVAMPIEDISVDLCDTCGGTWLDAGELEALTKKHSGGIWARMFGA